METITRRSALTLAGLGTGFGLTRPRPRKPRRMTLPTSDLYQRFLDEPPLYVQRSNLSYASGVSNTSIPLFFPAPYDVLVTRFVVAVSPRAAVITDGSLTLGARDFSQTSLMWFSSFSANVVGFTAEPERPFYVPAGICLFSNLSLNAAAPGTFNMSAEYYPVQLADIPTSQTQRRVDPSTMY